MPNKRTEICSSVLELHDYFKSWQEALVKPKLGLHSHRIVVVIAWNKSATHVDAAEELAKRARLFGKADAACGSRKPASEWVASWGTSEEMLKTAARLIDQSKRSVLEQHRQWQSVRQAWPKRASEDYDSWWGDEKLITVEAADLEQIVFRQSMNERALEFMEWIINSFFSDCQPPPPYYTVYSEIS